jgi:NosR/NirI family nitrous oxide reductase transcriptional regulator
MVIISQLTNYISKMLSILKKYAYWLHLSMPSGIVEPLPIMDSHGKSTVEGIWIAGDLTGIPLLKNAADTGNKAVESIFSSLSKTKKDETLENTLDLVIVGAGISGISAGLKATELGLHFVVIESNSPYSTIQDFPKGKPIYLYPKDYSPETKLNLTGDTKESLLTSLIKSSAVLLESNRIKFAKVNKIIKKSKNIFSLVDDESKEICLAKNVLICIGKTGSYRKLNVKGEDLDKVYHKLHDPIEFSGKSVAVIGGGDSALETSIALAQAGADVSIVHRGKDFSKSKEENFIKIQELTNKISVYLNSTISEIDENLIRITKFPDNDDNHLNNSKQVKKANQEIAIKNEIVFVQIGRKSPLDFFQRSGIPILGEWKLKKILTLTTMLLFCIGIYHWKMDGSLLSNFFKSNHWFPFGFSLENETNFPKGSIQWILLTNLTSPAFYYSLAYTLIIGIFGIKRVIKTPTKYIYYQTLSLFLIQMIPLFLLPNFFFPMLNSFGIYDSGIGKWLADEFFPIVNYGLGREYWRSVGLILAWPLFIWNVFSGAPMWGWLIVSLFQTFVIIPFIVWRWGKGAYCGWICSCGALAETLGDNHRKKMPHGIFWNKLNFIGQIVLGFAFLLLFLRIISWSIPGIIGNFSNSIFQSMLYSFFPLNYYYIVDVWMAGILGVGFYFHFSGRTWCRFACPLAALMHIYARFSQFRIFSEKKKCISCNMCTSVCHQGIDVMSFANKGLPMNDPQCVRCSACITNCPTQVLSFGRIDPKLGKIFDTISSERIVH